MKKIASFLALLFMTFTWAAEYYWVGGSGNWSNINHWRTTSGGSLNPSVIPGPTDNVYFDLNSGFTTNNKTITIDNTANCRNITFAGSETVPTLVESGRQTLNIYGSSEWQKGMPNIAITYIYYRHTGINKTIKSNGVAIGISNNYVYLEEESSIDLLDDFSTYYIEHIAGTLNTKNHNVTIGSIYDATVGSKTKTLNLGSSNVYLTNTYSIFKAASAIFTLNAGTSHIHFTEFLTDYNIGYYGLRTIDKQVYYDVTFEKTGGVIATPLNNTVSFNKVEFKGDGRIEGNNKFKQLMFSRTKTYELQAEGTQTISDLFSAQTTQCDGWSTINSTTTSSKANINAPSTTVIDASGIIMQDINASGGGNFIAVNSIDNGNNSGWTFPASTGQDLFWVGGSGNWNDKIHWSQSSGGNGGYCVPGPRDNTFFDVGSGFTENNKTVTIDNRSYTHDITFEGSLTPPTLTQTNRQTFNIYGSSEWQQGMSTINIANIYYRHTGNKKTIKSNNVITGTYSSIFFEEESSIDLLDDFFTYYIEHRAGTFNTKNNNVTISFMYDGTIGSKTRTLNLESSNIYMTSISSVFKAASSILILNAGTSHIHFTEFLTDYNVGYYGLRTIDKQVYYDVTFEKTGGVIATLLNSTVSFNKVEFKGDGRIEGNNKFKQLIFSPRKTYELQADGTQIITDLFSASTAQCDGWSTINSTSTGNKANIIASSSTVVNVSGVVMQDINSSGGANFTAVNSIDNGNNSGWTFPASTGQDLFWVGGSGNWNDKAHWSQKSGGIGGYCVPGPRNNTFFDGGSGFSSNNNTVTIDNRSYTRDVTFVGSTKAPVLAEVGRQTFNIYGSSEWQQGMNTISISNIYYRHTGNNKTIKSNGVVTGTNSNIIYLEEESSIDLLDHFSTSYLEHRAGTLNTNNHNLTISFYYDTLTGNKQKTLDLGSSNIYMTYMAAAFKANTNILTLKAGTSNIHFTTFSNGYNSSNYGLLTKDKQVYYDVTFESTGGVINTPSNESVSFNKVELKGDGVIFGNNTFNDLIFTAGKTYVLQANKTQTIENWTLGGNPCNVTFVKSDANAIPSNVRIVGDNTTFNFGDLRDINALGKTLHFGEQSTIANQNNNNLTYDPYNPGGFEGLGPDWLKHQVIANNPSTYIISTSNFYGNANTTYKWYKIDGTSAGDQIVISTDNHLDLRKTGYGTFKVIVQYSDGCKSEDDIYISSYLKKILVNPSIRLRVK